MLQLQHMDNTSEEEVMSKRAPRRRARATRETVAKRSVVAERLAKPVAKKTEEAAVVEKKTPLVASFRKAPTPLTAERKLRNKRRQQVAIVLVILLLGIGSSAAVGFQDKGVIDVNQTIAARNAKSQASGDGTQETIPVQNTSKAPNGGLRGLGVGSAPAEPAPVEEVATTTASTSAEATDSSEATLEAPAEEAVAEEVL